MDITIKINLNLPEAKVFFTKDKQTQIKTVMIDDLKHTIGATHQMSTGLLPAGTRFFEGTHQKFKILIEVAPKIRPLLIDFNEWERACGMPHSGRMVETLQVPCPACIFFFNVFNGRADYVNMVALKKSFENMNDVLYRFPYGNTGTDGGVCWNSVKIPEIKSPLMAREIVRLFFDSNFNGHLISTNTIVPLTLNQKLIKEPLQLLLELNKTHEFPLNALQKLDITMDKLFKKY